MNAESVQRLRQLNQQLERFLEQMQQPAPLSSSDALTELLIGVVETFSITWFGARAVDIGVYGLLLAILFVRPTGLLGGMTRQQRM